jgi:hypothetical protein
MTRLISNLGLPNLTFQVARIAGVSHWHLAERFDYRREVADVIMEATV